MTDRRTTPRAFRGHTHGDPPLPSDTFQAPVGIDHPRRLLPSDSLPVVVDNARQPSTVFASAGHGHRTEAFRYRIIEDRPAQLNSIDESARRTTRRSSGFETSTENDHNEYYTSWIHRAFHKSWNYFPTTTMLRSADDKILCFPWSGIR